MKNKKRNKNNGIFCSLVEKSDECPAFRVAIFCARSVLPVSASLVSSGHLLIYHFLYPLSLVIGDDPQKFAYYTSTNLENLDIEEFRKKKLNF